MPLTLAFPTVSNTSEVPTRIIALNTGIDIEPSMSQTQLIPPNEERTGLIILNQSNTPVYIGFGQGMSSSLYHQLKIMPDAYWEAPSPCYQGSLYAYSEGNSTVVFTEFVREVSPSTFN